MDTESETYAHQVLASAVRYLMDGRQHEAASMLVDCQLTLETHNVPVFHDSPESQPVSFLTLRCPRRVHDALKSAVLQRKELNGISSVRGPDDPRLPSTDQEHMMEIEGQIRAALLAVLPGPVEIDYRVELTELVTDWRSNLRHSRRLAEIIEQIESFRFCGPSDDPDEQTAVVYGLRSLVAKFHNAARGVNNPDLQAAMRAVDMPDDIYEAYDAHAQIVAMKEDINAYAAAPMSGAHSTMLNIDVFISHSNRDRAIVKRVITLIPIPLT